MTKQSELRDELALALVPVVARYSCAELREFLFRWHGVNLPIATHKSEVAGAVIRQLVPTKPPRDRFASIVAELRELGANV